MGVLKLKTGGVYVDISNIVGDHNYLDGLQGGSASEYYHLSLSRYNDLKTTGSPTFVTVTATGNFVLPAAHVENQTFGVYEGASNLIRSFRPTGANGYNFFIGLSGNNTMSPGGGAVYLASGNVYIGANAGVATTTGYGNFLLGTDAGTKITTGNRCVGIGANGVLNANVSGAALTAIGSAAGYSCTGSSSVFIGNAAGYYETAGNKLFIDNDTRASEADGRLKALVYGVFAAATVNQYLTVNGNLTVTNAFGCNAAAAQTAYVSGGAVVPGAGAFGFSSAANAAALATLVTNIRLALVANGIMS